MLLVLYSLISYIEYRSALEVQLRFLIYILMKIIFRTFKDKNKRKFWRKFI